MSVAELKTKAAAAKKAYKANKDDKSLKKAYKAVKAELEAAEKKAAEEAAAQSNKRKAADSSDDESEDEAPAPKRQKVDVDALKKAAADAKAAYKANKDDKALKAAYKAAKKAFEEAEANKDTAMEAADDETKTEEKPAAPEEDVLAGLKKNKSVAAANNSSDKAPNAKLFLGNLSWDIDDDGIKEFFKECGEPVDLHWLTDRESGRFKGCGFIEFASVELAQKGFAKNGEELLGRPIKIDYATPRPGGERKKGGNKFQNKPIGEMPEGCTTAFAGNLSFDIDDDQMHEFAKDCGEIKGIRWLTDRDSGDFKGCGFVEFYDGESVKKFVQKNGTELLGRAIRLDYSAPRQRN